QLIGLESVDATEVGKEQDPVVSGANEEVLDDVILLQLRATHALAAALLCLVGINLGALGVASSGDRDNYILAGDQVFVGDVAGCSNNLSAAFIAILFDDFLQLIMHDRTLTLGPRQDVFVIGDLELDLCQLINNLLALQSGQTKQLHGQDSVRSEYLNVQQLHQTITVYIHGPVTEYRHEDHIEYVQHLNQPT